MADAVTLGAVKKLQNAMGVTNVVSKFGVGFDGVFANFDSYSIFGAKAFQNTMGPTHDILALSSMLSNWQSGYIQAFVDSTTNTLYAVSLYGSPFYIKKFDLTTGSLLATSPNLAPSGGGYTSLILDRANSELIMIWNDNGTDYFHVFDSTTLVSKRYYACSMAYGLSFAYDATLRKFIFSPSVASAATTATLTLQSVVDGTTSTSATLTLGAAASAAGYLYCIYNDITARQSYWALSGGNYPYVYKYDHASNTWTTINITSLTGVAAGSVVNPNIYSAADDPTRMGYFNYLSGGSTGPNYLMSINGATGVLTNMGAMITSDMAISTFGGSDVTRAPHTVVNSGTLYLLAKNSSGIYYVITVNLSNNTQTILDTNTLYWSSFIGNWIYDWTNNRMLWLGANANYQEHVFTSNTYDLQITTPCIIILQSNSGLSEVQVTIGSNTFRKWVTAGSPAVIVSPISQTVQISVVTGTVLVTWGAQ